MDTTAGYAFNFKGQPAGLLAERPSRPGNYRYMAFRGPGHYAFSLSLEQQGSAECTCRLDAGVIHFTVTGRTHQRELIIDAVHCTSSSDDV